MGSVHIPALLLISMRGYIALTYINPSRQAAVAWWRNFNRQPSAADPDSRFVKVLREVLKASMLPELGKDAIRTAIKGPPKS